MYTGRDTQSFRNQQIVLGRLVSPEDVLVQILRTVSCRQNASTDEYSFGRTPDCLQRISRKGPIDVTCRGKFFKKR